MADGHGGHRTPANPAPASGPGRLSKRTDGGPGQKVMLQSGGDYGAREESLQQQRGAAMSQQDPVTPAAVHAAAGGAGGPTYGGGDFGGATQRPGEPVTHGADIGPGGGPEALGYGGQMPDGYITNLLQQFSASDVTGTLAPLYLIAQQRKV